MKERGFSFVEMGKKLGRGKSTVNSWVNENYVPRVIVPLLLNTLDCDIEDLQRSEVSVHEIAELGEMKGMIKALETSISEIYDVVCHISETISPDLLTNADKAVILLKQMMNGTARVDEQDYIHKCNELDIDNHARKYAIEKTDCLVHTIGYGKNAKRVIYKRARGE